MNSNIQIQGNKQIYIQLKNLKKEHLKQSKTFRNRHSFKGSHNDNLSFHDRETTPTLKGIKSHYTETGIFLLSDVSCKM